MNYSDRRATNETFCHLSFSYLLTNQHDKKMLIDFFPFHNLICQDHYLDLLMTNNLELFVIMFQHVCKNGILIESQIFLG
jgi:hypothetical protein